MATPFPFRRLLPNHATQLEYDFAGIWKDRIEPIKAPFRPLWNAETISKENLPFLAWTMGVDLWDDEWAEEKQRYVVRWSFRYKALKGSIRALAPYLDLVGAKLRGVIRPPDKTFLSPAFNEEEARAWLKKFPQLRIYPYVAQSRQRQMTFTTAANGRAKHYLGTGFPAETDVLDRYKRTAKLFEPRDGSIVDLEHRTVKRTLVTGQAIDVQEVTLPGKKSGAIYLGNKPKARLFLGLAGTRDRLVTIDTPLTYGYTFGQSQYHTVVPSYQPIKALPDLIADTGKRVYGQRFPGPTNGHSSVLRGAYLPPSTAWQRIYERMYLHDPARLPDNRPRVHHIGYTRLGFAKFTAKVTAEITGKRHPRALSRFVHGFTITSTRKPLDRAMEALAVSKSNRDTILLQTKYKRVMRVGDRIPIGTVRIGDRISY